MLRWRVWKGGRARMRKRLPSSRWTTCWWTLCGARLPPGRASGSTCVMFPKSKDRRRKLPTLTMIRRGSGVAVGLPEKRREHCSALEGEDLHQFLRRNHFELGIGTVAGLFIRAPSAKLRHVAEAAALHVLVSHFDYQLRPQRLP